MLLDCLLREAVLTHVLLLLVDMADLKPNVLLRQRTGRRVDNVFEALESGH